MGEPAQKLLTAADLAGRTGLSVRYFQKLGPHVTWATQPGGDGQHWLFSKHGFEDWLAAGCKVAGGKWHTRDPKRVITSSDPSETGGNLVDDLRDSLRENLPPSRAGYVYFIAPSMRSPRVKIGWAVDPHQRLRDLQAAHPEKLRVLFAAPGSRRDEHATQLQFSKFRIREDWFRFSDAIRSHIERGQNG